MCVSCSLNNIAIESAPIATLLTVDTTASSFVYIFKKKKRIIITIINNNNVAT